MKVSLTTPAEVKRAVRAGKSVFWRESPVVETRSGNMVVNTPINKERYRSKFLHTVIMTYGVIDFYYETGE
jgi:hypothetical protein